MSEIGKYTNLKTAVSYFLDQHEKSGIDFDQCWVLALRCLVSLGFNVSAEPLTLRLPVNGNNTVTLPSGYLGWSKIGVLNERNEISTLKINNGLTTYASNNPNRISKLTPDVTDGIGALSSLPFYSNYSGNGMFTPMFGIGGGLIQYGECRVDERNNIIILPSDFEFTSILLEFISSPERNAEDYMVETCMVEAVIAFIEWKKKINTEQNYYARVIEGRRSLDGKKVTLQVINQVVREAHGMKLKA
jgi:hypothetical protein